MVTDTKDEYIAIKKDCCPALESEYISLNQSAIKVLKWNISFKSHEVTLVYKLHRYNSLESHKKENLKRVWTNIVKKNL